MHPVFERLIVELERPRPLTGQVLRHLAATYGIGLNEAGDFLDRELPGFDDSAVDLALSSLFTPKLQDQAVFADLLLDQSIPTETSEQWIHQLESRPTPGCLVTESGTEHRFPLRVVTLERFVHRLRLEATVPAPLLHLIQSLPPAEERPLLLAVARRAVWNTPERQELLTRYLSQNLSGDGYRRGDVAALLALMESAGPSSVEDLLRRLPEWEQVARAQVTATHMPRPFFNLQVEEMHGGGRDTRPANTRIADQKQAELEFFGRLRLAFSESEA